MNEIKDNWTLTWNFIDEKWGAKNCWTSQFEEEMIKEAPKEMTTNSWQHRVLGSMLFSPLVSMKGEFQVKLRNHYLMVPYTPHPVLWQVRELRNPGSIWQIFASRRCVSKAKAKLSSSQKLYAAQPKHMSNSNKRGKRLKIQVFQIISRENLKQNTKTW